MQKDVARLQELDDDINGYDRVLRAKGISPDDSTHQSQDRSNGAPFRDSEPTLSNVLKEVVISGKPRSFDVNELVEIAKSRDVDFGEKNPHRAVGFTLLGISRGNTIKRLDDGRWKAA